MKTDECSCTPPKERCSNCPEWKMGITMPTAEHDHELLKRIEKIIDPDSKMFPHFLQNRAQKVVELIQLDRINQRIDEENVLYNEHMQAFDDDPCDVIKARIAALESQKNQLTGEIR